MKKILRPILIGVLILIFLNSACTALAGTSPTAVGTILPGGQAQSPVPTSNSGASITATDTPVELIIPITGENVVEMQCQFCVNSLTHAVFIFPEFAIFDVESSTPVTCLTAQVVNGKRVLICNGTQLTSFNLKICSDSSNCLLFPVALQACPLLNTIGTPLVTGTPMTPVFLTAINTLLPSSTPRPSNPNPSPTQTGAPAPATSTTQPPPATTEPPPPATTEPPPPAATQPPATVAPTDPPAATTNPPTPVPATDSNKKPTKTPKR